jgi:hypothetical protein
MFRSHFTLAAVVVFSAAALPDSVIAQVIVGRGGGGISVGIPGVGGVRVGAPLRRGVVVAPYGIPYAGPYGAAYGYGPVPRYAARPIAPEIYASQQTLPTARELQLMNDSELLNATSSLAAQLHEDLNRFDTGDTWQRYLRFPDELLPRANSSGDVALSRQALLDTLARFDRTAANQRYGQISGLDSYVVTHAALAELTRRFGSSGEASVVNSSDRGIPPALPQPPQSIAAATADSADVLPAERGQSIEMRNLHAAPRAAAAPADEFEAATDARDSKEELPTPPPSLIAPRNDASSTAAGEHSVLAK